jgi:hypothetical protein
MSRLTLLLTLAGCNLRPYDFDASATDTDLSTSTTTAPDPTTAPTTSITDATSSSTGSTGYTFIKPTDGGTGTKQCDQWIQDCPEGQKCMPYSGDGDNAWESLKCVPIVPNPDGLGDPCMVFGGGVSGEDTCDKHMLCWGVDWETGIGTCTAMCKGSPENPKCEQPMHYCHQYADGTLTLCFHLCDPLAQDCPNGKLCIPNPMDPNSFTCVIDASGDDGQAFDPCESTNACDVGLFCANPALAAECDPMAAGCCLPFCDTSVMPPPCPGANQQCLPWYEEGQAPPILKNVGVCGLPQ